MKKRVLTILFAVMAICGFGASPDDVRTCVKNGYLCVVASPEAVTWAATIDGEGRWPDVDYQDQSTSLWQLEKHLDRLVEMAASLGGDPQKNPAVYDAVIRGLRQWFDGGYTNPNWWYAKIGVPRRMLSLAYLLDGMLPPVLEARIDDALRVIDSDDFPARPGGDRIQVLSNHAKVLLWRRDYSGVGAIFKKIEDEARVAPYEEVMFDAGGGPAVRNAWRPSGRGVQADMSFHHRGDRVDSTLSYGLELPEFFIYWAKLLKDTEWAFSPDAVRFIADYYLDGVSRHLVAGRYAEPSIMNREMSRPGAGVISPEFASGLLEICEGYREPELREALAVIQGSKEFSESYAANFFESGYFAFARPAFQTAVRYHSQRNANQEAPHNREGIRNHFRGDGACMLSVTGREYADIAPLFDFRMVPGATTPLLPYDSLAAWGDVQVLNPPVTFAGAAADSLYGAVAFDFISPRGDLKARKGYFFFDDEYVCLGSAVTSGFPYPVVTTVEQCLSPSGETGNEEGWYFHAGNAYHVIQGDAEGEVSRKRGSWSNCVENAEHASLEAEGDVFTLYISHGIAPSGDTYAYAVCPGTDAPKSHSFEIIANEAALQAVASNDGKIIYIIFYEPGSIATPYGTYSADRSCVMMVRDGKETVFDS